MDEPSKDPPEANVNKLNPESEEFDPIAAIYTENNPFVDPNVPPFDNIATFESKYSKIKSLEVDLTEQKQNKPSSDTSASTSTTKELPLERRFQQEMVKGYRRAKHKKNVLNISENFRGPLKLLHEFMENRTRIKVYIRHNHGIRGYITGYVEIFDKHWNIVLKDAEEFYRRRKFYYSEQTGSFGESSAEECSARLKELGIELPQVSVKSINRKNVECRRKIPQILVRGEQIALITRHVEPP